jgi:hypothetical protein
MITDFVDAIFASSGLLSNFATASLAASTFAFIP